MKTCSFICSVLKSFKGIVYSEIKLLSCMYLQVNPNPRDILSFIEIVDLLSVLQYNNQSYNTDKIFS